MPDDILISAHESLENLNSAFYDLYFNYDGSGVYDFINAPYNNEILPGSDLRVRTYGNTPGDPTYHGNMDRFVLNIGCLEKRSVLEAMGKSVHQIPNFPKEFGCQDIGDGLGYHCQCQCENYEPDGSDVTSSENITCDPTISWTPTVCFYECMGACWEIGDSNESQYASTEFQS